ncbi:nuclease-related domain-containing protein [Enterococcus cecorum]|uniref:nuclease-related domain-containing protein n=1 Tax=Enterococcus cecorum TaxID=44008 RepID=UPI00148D4736|nr:nuclease-related domain-containing protein [Enterococcus cecorum]
MYLRFQRSSYRSVSNNSFLKTFINKGFWGEYRIFATLEKLAKPHHIFTNLYIPRKDGTTTEIDLIYLSHYGIFVIESKNYNGWIFGNEKQKYWTQTFENKQKFRFFNPIWQNTTHINALKEVLPEELHQQLHSLIVFNNQET